MQMYVNPIVYAIEVLLEVFLFVLLVSQVCDLEFKLSKRNILVILGTAALVFTLDGFVLDYVKTPIRLYGLMAIYTMYFGLFFRLSVTKALIANSILFIINQLIDGLGTIVLYEVLGFSFTQVYANYNWAYATCLTYGYLALLILKLFKIKIVSLNKLVW